VFSVQCDTRIMIAYVCGYWQVSSTKYHDTFLEKYISICITDTFWVYRYHKSLIQEQWYIYWNSGLF